MRAAPNVRPGALYFATAAPGYLDKTNASAIHAALALDAQAPAFDMLGSVRSGAGALSAAIDAARPTLAVLADIRTGLPGGGDERDGGDGAVAFLLADARDRSVLAEPVARASATAEFLERWRLPGDAVSRQWEERFGEHAYVPLGEAAVADALKQAGVSAAAVTELDRHRPPQPRQPSRRLVGGRQQGNRRRRPRRQHRQHRDRARGAHARRRARPREAGRADRGGLAGRRLRRHDLAGDGGDRLPSAGAVGGRAARRGRSRHLRDVPDVARLPPARAAAPARPRAPEAPPSFRAESWKFAFTGSRCQACGTRHVPPQRVCVKCHAVDRMTPERLADIPATIATFTVDRLAYSLSPPVVVAVIDFEGGGRFQCEMTDVDPAAVKIGDRVEHDVPTALHRRWRPQLLLEGSTAPRARRVDASSKRALRGPPLISEPRQQ